MTFWDSAFEFHMRFAKLTQTTVDRVDKRKIIPFQLFSPNKRILIDRDYVKGLSAYRFIEPSQENPGYTTWSTLVWNF
jgi:hypothetical protein